MSTVGVDVSSLQVGWFGLRVGSLLALSLHSSYEPRHWHF